MKNAKYAAPAVLVVTLVFCMSIATRGDVVTPSTQTLPVSTSATIDVSIPGSGSPSICVPIPLPVPCTEAVTLTVMSGPDAGTTVTTDVTLPFNLGDPISLADTITNDGTAGTDVISTTETGETDVAFNNVDVVWTSSGSSGGGTMPEPSSMALLLSGLTAMGFARFRVRREE